MDGIVYQKPCALLLGLNDDYPLFARLDDIFIIDIRFLFSVTLLNTLLFNHHYQGYVIDQMSDKKIIIHTQLYTLHSPCIYTLHWPLKLSFVNITYVVQCNDLTMTYVVRPV